MGNSNSGARVNSGIDAFLLGVGVAYPRSSPSLVCGCPNFYPYIPCFTISNFNIYIRVRCWNGKIVNIERKEDGILLTIDFIQKPTTTCYEEL